MKLCVIPFSHVPKVVDAVCGRSSLFNFNVIALSSSKVNSRETLSIWSFGLRKSSSISWQYRKANCHYSGKIQHELLFRNSCGVILSPNSSQVSAEAQAETWTRFCILHRLHKATICVQRRAICDVSWRRDTTVNSRNGVRSLKCQSIWPTVENSKSWHSVFLWNEYLQCPLGFNMLKNLHFYCHVTFCFRIRGLSSQHSTVLGKLRFVSSVEIYPLNDSCYYSTQLCISYWLQFGVQFY